jgi:hypothetical protein
MTIGKTQETDASLDVGLPAFRRKILEARV